MLFQHNYDVKNILIFVRKLKIINDRMIRKLNLIISTVFKVYKFYEHRKKKKSTYYTYDIRLRRITSESVISN